MIFNYYPQNRISIGFFVKDSLCGKFNIKQLQQFRVRTTFVVTPTFGKVKTSFTFGGEFLENLNFADSYTLTNNVL